MAKLENNQLSLAEASEQLSAAAEPAAIPAWEAIVSPASPKAALAVVQALGKMKDPEASLALTRHALASNWSEVRSKAVEFLKERDFNSFVPALLGELQGPWVGWRELVKTNQDQLVYRFTAIADGLDQQSLRVLDQATSCTGRALSPLEMPINSRNKLPINSNLFACLKMIASMPATV